MIDVHSLSRVDDETFSDKNGVTYTQLFPIEEWDCPEKFEEANIVGYEPMTAKELDTEEKQDEAFSIGDNYIEEKFDGTRALLYFLEDGCRVFSRRISKKTDFYVENTDSLPQLRTVAVPELAGTILDGEMFINGRPFRDVSSTLNCLWDKAIDRQIELGFITLHTFDILFYKGIDLRNMSLAKRKVYLRLAVEQAGCIYIEQVKHYKCGDLMKHPVKVQGVSTYNLVNFWQVKDHEPFYSNTERDEWFDKHVWTSEYPALLEAKRTGAMTPRAYYELIVATGGEGVIIKPSSGKYYHKRGWEYSKVKKFLTRELIVIDFDVPTREYEGKAPKTWEYWEGDTPVTRHWYYNQVGNLRLGVLISKKEYEKIPKNKRGESFAPSEILGGGYGLDENYLIMEVCECGGFDDDTRAYFTDNQQKVIGTVVEVKSNEIMRDSGRLRHPRYLRMREDKAPDRCTWRDHIL